MTVNVQIPYNLLLGDGSQTTFVFTFDFLEEQDIYVILDGELLPQTGDYVIQNTNDEGGEIVFDEAPADASTVFIFRDTTRSQQIDYVSGDPFPAETHELGFDKMMFILQELITSTFRGIDVTGAVLNFSFDLSTNAGEFTVTIENSGGTDAVLPMWVSATTAGVYAGEYIAAASLPADESATTKPDGYVWLGYD